jgi:hypothetical protein
MAAEGFVVGLALFNAVLLYWGFRVLPGEKWQILASVPRKKTSGNNWTGLNLTYYGFLVASSYCIGTTITIILLGAVHVPLGAILFMALLVALVCLPASKVIAVLVEKKKHTLTVGGALFVGVLLGPWAMAVGNQVLHSWMESEVPVMTALAVMTIGYAFGEGTGRLACISFGCCYGKPLSQCPPAVQTIFKRFHFVFSGETKKIAYADGLDGVPVIPIQAVTSTFYLCSALLGTYAFLQGYQGPAFLGTVVCIQGWRFVSEFFRADCRGGQQISAYQWMSLFIIIYACFLPFFFHKSRLPNPDILAGLNSLWNPVLLVFLQVLWLILFLFTGRSQVTGSIVSVHVFEDRI